MPKNNCEKCGASPATTQLDPFALEVYDEHVQLTLCARCLQERHDDA